MCLRQISNKHLPLNKEQIPSAVTVNNLSNFQIQAIEPQTISMPTQPFKGTKTDSKIQQDIYLFL